MCVYVQRVVYSRVEMVSSVGGGDWLSDRNSPVTCGGPRAGWGEWNVTLVSTEH